MLGCYSSAGQTTPEYDPGLTVDCPICGKLLGPESGVRTISLAPIGGDRSYFYRTHRLCHAGLSAEEQQALDGQMLAGRWPKETARTA